MDSEPSSRIDIDEEILQELVDNILLVYIVMMAACHIHNLFNANKLDEGGQPTSNHNEADTNILSHMREVPPLFKALTIFEVGELDLLASLICPTMLGNAQSTCVPRLQMVSQ